MRTRFLFLFAFLLVAACSAFVDDIYANLRNDDGGEPADTGPLPDGGSNCLSGVLATPDGGSPECLSELLLGDAGQNAYAVASFADDLYVLDGKGAVWTCTGDCEELSLLAQGIGLAGNAPGHTLAADDAGVYWSTGQSPASAIEFTTSSGATEIVKPVGAQVVAASGGYLAWSDGQGDVRQCLISAGCRPDAGPVDNQLGVSSLAITTGTGTNLYWAYGTVKAAPLGPVATQPTQFSEPGTAVVALSGGRAVWTSGGFLYESGKSLDSGVGQFQIAGPALQIASTGTTVVWATDSTIQTCATPNSPVAGALNSCASAADFEMTGLQLSSVLSDQLGANAETIIVIDASGRALKISRH
ncbi:MAG TPA: hypothetical protein VGH28_32020 [Polyangiaceae bacterium]|jgi:hypothetical protein